MAAVATVVTIYATIDVATDVTTTIVLAIVELIVSTSSIRVDSDLAIEQWCLGAVQFLIC